MLGFVSISYDSITIEYDEEKKNLKAVRVLKFFDGKKEQKTIRNFNEIMAEINNFANQEGITVDELIADKSKIIIKDNALKKLKEGIVISDEKGVNHTYYWDEKKKLFCEKPILVEEDKFFASGDIGDKLVELQRLNPKSLFSLSKDNKRILVFTSAPLSELVLPTGYRVEDSHIVDKDNNVVLGLDAIISRELDEEKPVEEKPAEEKPAEEKPAEEKPAEEKPAEEKPAEEKPAEEKPDKPRTDIPVGADGAVDVDSPIDHEEESKRDEEEKKEKKKSIVKTLLLCGAVIGVGAVILSGSAKELFKAIFGQNKGGGEPQKDKQEEKFTGELTTGKTNEQVIEELKDSNKEDKPIVEETPVEEKSSDEIPAEEVEDIDFDEAEFRRMNDLIPAEEAPVAEYSDVANDEVVAEQPEEVSELNEPYMSYDVSDIDTKIQLINDYCFQYQPIDFENYVNDMDKETVSAISHMRNDVVVGFKSPQEFLYNMENYLKGSLTFNGFPVKSLDQLSADARYIVLTCGESILQICPEYQYTTSFDLDDYMSVQINEACQDLYSKGYGSK